MSDRPKKRSLTIAGHRTSLSLEDDFWEALKQMGKAQDRSIAQLIEEIDSNRGGRSLSGAVRSAVLEYYRNASRGN